MTATGISNRRSTPVNAMLTLQFPAMLTLQFPAMSTTASIMGALCFSICLWILTDFITPQKDRTLKHAFPRADVISTAGRNLEPENSTGYIRISPFGRNDNIQTLPGLIEKPYFSQLHHLIQV